MNVISFFKLKIQQEIRDNFLKMPNFIRYNILLLETRLIYPNLCKLNLKNTQDNKNHGMILKSSLFIYELRETYSCVVVVVFGCSCCWSGRTSENLWVSRRISCLALGHTVIWRVRGSIWWRTMSPRVTNTSCRFIWPLSDGLMGVWWNFWNWMLNWTTSTPFWKFRASRL